METLYDSNHEELTNGLYVGNNNFLIMYIIKERTKWFMELPGIKKRLEFNPIVLAKELNRVKDLNSLLEETKEEWRIQHNNYVMGEEFSPELITAQDRFAFVYTKQSKN